MSRSNTRILLNSRPQGWVTDENFKRETTAVVDPAEGQVLVRNLFMSVDPYMRARMNEMKSYIPNFQIGEVLQAGVVGVVDASRHPDYKEGDIVTGMLNWENYTMTEGKDLRGSPLTKIKKSNVPLSYYLGILGMPGMTAYTGLIGIGKAKAGENVFVTAASGAVGSVVGQIAKNIGCHVVGSAGGDEKCAYIVDELGFDQAIDYKATDNAFKAVQKAFPNMIDVHFENTGGPMFEAALMNMNFMGRIALCGLISDYNRKLEDMPAGPRGLFTLIGRNVLMQGFIVSNYPDHCAKWIEVAVPWLMEGKLKYRETVSEGIENAPSAFMGMLKGQNFGKQIVKIADL